MNSDKSFGYDEIGTKIIKITAKKLLTPLTHIFNLSFSFGIIANRLKIAQVTQIFKINEQNKFENYRPVSVLSCLIFKITRETYDQKANTIY